MIYEKSKKGLADIYEEDFKIDVLGASANPEDDANQEEIDTLCESLFYELDQLSNFHFTPKPVNTEAKVLTQGVEAFKIEDAVPFGKEQELTKPGDNVLMMSEAEMSKLQKRQVRSKRKRHIKSHLKRKEVRMMEEKRLSDLPMHDKFESRQLEKKMREKAKTNKTGQANNEHKSSKFFEKMQSISKTDTDRKRAKQPEENNKSAKRFKL